MRALELGQRYPLAVLALVGIASGGALHSWQPALSRGCLGIVVCAVGLPLAWNTLRAALRGKFATDIIATLAIATSAVLGEWGAGAVVALMQSGGEALEDYGLKEANRSLESLLRRAPTVAVRECAGGVEEVPASEVVTGDRVVARPGDILPVDGTVLSGAGSVDESALTGEPVPLAKQQGDKVYSGTINLAGGFTYRADSNAARSKYERIVHMVQGAQGERAPVQRLADRYTPAFTFVALAMATIAWAISGEAHRALAVLVVATPCPLIIATPLAVLTGINRAAALNVIAKGGAALERLAAVDTVAFDKTGTLTIGTPGLVDIECTVADATREDILRSAAALESRSAHVLGKATWEAARRAALVPPEPETWSEVPGAGVAGMIDGKYWVFGTEGHLRSEGVSFPETRDHPAFGGGRNGRTVAFAARDGHLVGRLAYEDTVRPEARETVERLRRHGVGQIVLLTGDTVEAGGAIAAAVGIDVVHSRLQPEDKRRILADLARSGRKVMMVGDGINDAPALASAHVSIAMGDHGAGIATDAADLVVTVENVGRIADALALGRRMTRVARQGILLGMGASTILMVFAALGYIPPTLGAALQEVLDLAALANALRVRRD
ncbi:MAG: heavy metal translocating P-type ATPase [Armatimonadota bacterium]